jgi:hypothetical protein
VGGESGEGVWAEGVLRRAGVGLGSKKLYTVELTGGGPVGRDGSCQLLSIRVSTAVAWQLSLRLSLKSIMGLFGKYKTNMCYFLGGLASKPLFPPTILYKICYCTQTLPHH